MSQQASLVLPRTVYRWWRDEAAAELMEIQARMSAAQVRGDDMAAYTLRRLQDRQIALVAHYDRLSRDGSLPSYQYGIKRDGLVTFSEPVDARFNVMVAGPFCDLRHGSRPGSERSERSRPDMAAGGSYVPVTRKVSPVFRKIETRRHG